MTGYGVSSRSMVYYANPDIFTDIDTRDVPNPNLGSKVRSNLVGFEMFEFDKSNVRKV